MSYSTGTTAPRQALAEWLASANAAPGDKLPPERDLCARLGMSRGDLRKAMLSLEAEGVVERHVGRGTFLKAVETDRPDPGDYVARLAEITSPHDAMMARLSLEPELAGYAAIHAAPRHLAEARGLADAMRRADNWAEYEQLDARLHELIAVASGNPLLAELHRIVNAVRVSVVWGRLEIPAGGPPADYHSFAEHDAIIEALESRDRVAAHGAMRAHLKSVRATLLKDD